MKKKVLYLVNSSLSSPTGGGRTRIISAANQVEKHGYEVVVLCFVPPLEFVLRMGKLISSMKVLSTETQGKVLYFPRLTLTRIGWISTLNDLFCGLAIFVVCLFFKIGLAHCHGVDSTLYALKARWLLNSLKIVADIHGAAVEEYLYERKVSEPDQLQKRLEASESHVLKCANWLVFVSEAMQLYYEKKYKTVYERSIVIPCATTTAGRNLNGSRVTLRRKYNIDRKLVFCYVGSGEAYQLPTQMCILFKTVLADFPNAFFLILSHHQEVFESQLKDCGIDQANYRIEAVSHSMVFDLLQMGDIGFLLRDDSIVNRVSSPTKFAEYCLSGMPVITTKWVGDISRFVRDRKIGAIIDLEFQSLGPEITAFISEVERNRFEYIEKCPRFVHEEFSWEAFGERLSVVYASLID